MAGILDYLPRPQMMTDDELNPIPLGVEQIAAVSQASKASPALQKYIDLAGEAALEEQAGLSQLQKYIQGYQQQPRGIDYRPLATFVDQLSPRGGNATQRLAEQMAPESEDARAANIMKLQDMLNQRRGGFTKTQMDFLNAQLKQEETAAQRAAAQQLAREKFEQQQELQQEKLELERERTAAYREQGEMRKDIAEMQLEAARTAKQEAQDRADARQQAGLEQKKELKVADQVVKLGKELSGELPALSGNVAKIEELLGASLDTFDPKTKTLAGKKVDLPGKSIVGIGRVYMPGSTGEEFESAFKGIFNSLLKQRSGAAVTNQELARMRAEFAAGQFNTEEKMLEAVYRFKRALRKEMMQKEKSFLPEAVERFRNQGGLLTEDLLGLEVPPPAPERKEYQGKTYEKKGDTWVEVTQ